MCFTFQLANNYYLIMKLNKKQKHQLNFITTCSFKSYKQQKVDNRN